MESRAWARLLEAAQAQIHNRRNKYYRTPLKSDQSVSEMQWELGEAAGIELFCKLPQIVMDASRAIITENEQNAPQAGTPPNVP